MEIQDYIKLLRPEPMFGTDIVNVCLPAEHASAIADLLEGMSAKDASWQEEHEEMIDMHNAAQEKINKAMDRIAALREENEILWSALNLATGRLRELWRPDI